MEDLLSYLTLEEKLGQLDLFHSGDDPGLERSIERGRIGGVVGVTSPTLLQKVATGHSRLGIPLLLVETSVILPISPWALAASWDESLARCIGAGIADNAAGRGFNCVSAPRVTGVAGGDIATTHIAAGEPYLGTRLASAFVHGAQGGGERGGVLAIPSWRGGSDGDGAAWSIGLMNSDGIVALDCPELDRTTAQRIGFSGLLLAECRRISELVGHQYATTTARSALDAAERAIAAGLVSEPEIDMAVRGVLAAKHAVGLFRDPERRSAFPGAGITAAAENETIRKTFVLLRNEAGILPFSPVSDRVLVVGTGDGAARACADALDRAGIGHSMAPGLAQRRAGESPSEPTPGDAFALSLTRDAARRADFAIVVLDSSHFSAPAGEGWPQPTNATLAMLQGLAPAGTRLLAIIATPGPVDLAAADQYFAAVLQSWDLRAGYVEALSDVLSGRFSPQGRMPIRAGRFLAGHGLGFGESVVSGIKLTPGVNAIIASAQVRNAGAFAMRETVQVYARRGDEDLRLIDFAHVFLAPGAAESVSFKLGIDALGVPGATQMLELPAGRYEILIGKSAARLTGSSIEISPSFARAIAMRNASSLRLASG